MKFDLSFSDLDALYMGYTAKAEIYERALQALDPNNPADDADAERWQDQADEYNELASRWAHVRSHGLAQVFGALPKELPSDTPCQELPA